MDRREAIESLQGDLHLMLPLDDAVKVVGRICDEWWTLEDGDIEFIRNELEQKCYRIDQTTDCISRADTIKAMCQECKVFPDDEVNCADCTEVAIVRGMPSVSGEEVDYCNNCPYISYNNEDCISRQQAIEVVSDIYVLDDAQLHIRSDCVDLLESLPPVTPTDQTIKEIMDFIGGMNMVDEISNEAYTKISVFVDDGTPTERTGEWIESEIPNELYVCSECGGACWSYDYERNIIKSNYCPNCGAKMKGGTENE